MRKNRYAWALLGLLAATGAIACDDDPDPVDPIVPLTEQVKAALDDAIQDSYRTYYTYTVVLEDMGQAMPFTSIVKWRWSPPAIPVIPLRPICCSFSTV